MKKILIISGSTASGKTNLALKLAREFNGEIISADSRQVYLGMDIVTGKDLPRNVGNADLRSLPYDFDGIKVSGLDMVQPNQEFDVSHFVEFARKKIDEIQSQGKLPIIVGGTAFWIKSLINPPETIGVPQDQALRKKLTKLNLEDLQKKLVKLDKQKWKEMNESDRNNPRRLIRAIEIKAQNSKVKAQNQKSKLKKLNLKDILWIGLKVNLEDLEKKIEKRVRQRLKEGAIEETEKLASKYDWDLPSMSGIGYRDLRQFLEKKQNLEETIKLWSLHEFQYAKRQMTFTKKIDQIKWFDLQEANSYDKIKEKVKRFLMS